MTRVLQGEFVPRCLAGLKRIVRETDASIVLSSTWRETPAGVAAVNDQLARHGLPCLVGATACLSSCCTSRRAREIAAWLGEQPANTVSSFLILDDDDVCRAPGAAADDGATRTVDELRGHFVRTDKGVGLCQDDCDRAIRILLEPTAPSSLYSSVGRARDHLGAPPTQPSSAE